MAFTSVEVHPSNAEQARAWNGDEGAYWAAHVAAFESSVSSYDGPFAAATTVTAGERVLDVGCGAGGTTLAAARRAGPTGDALGVDLSAALLDVARSRARAEGIANVHFLQADAQVHPFPTAGFDVLVSRMGAMFFGDPVAAFTNLARAVRPGGRLVLLTWQPLDRNEWLTAVLAALAAGRTLPGPPPDAPGPFGLSSPDRVHDTLAAAGWSDVRCTGVEAPVQYGDDVDSAHEWVSGRMSWLLADLDDERRRQALEDLRRSMQEHLEPGGVQYPSAAWLVTARRP
ncbi:class I SAM-dependent methyltransferase [Modestobacter marinus]|uniref:class I SAM-dependent methyltransferase n=1 Tax=Modestobacter marinus TaxID=477641 RepID=UPI001C952777|nr:class I SAM-dependent methyltransferase [Modestobacter marinus]